MVWLLLGVVYSLGYVAAGWLLRDQPIVLGWFRHYLVEGKIGLPPVPRIHGGR